MFEVHVTVSCPDVLEAAKILAGALGGIEVSDSKVAALAERHVPALAPAPAANPIPAGLSPNPTTPGYPFNPVNPTPQPVPVATPANGPAAPVQPGSATQAAAPIPTPPAGQTVPAQPGGYTAPSVPVASAPGFTLEQVSKAGADLITAHPDKMPALMGLLSQYGVQTVHALRPEHLGSFATQLRGMGAKI